MTKRMSFIFMMLLMVHSVQAQESPYLSGAKKRSAGESVCHGSAHQYPGCG